ncbi:hypothetical protein [Teredinibacter turnerae]|uniref:hypothetical protein n=1 Tax=Teredinibacter turnerae TaxID=2426 RepID=UPI0005F7A224|nr:hypothetical protein [Teredinibacter turnerae]
MTMAIKKWALGPIISASLLSGGQLNAAEASPVFIASTTEAAVIVEEYKTLRSSCIVAQGEERMACFNALKKQNTLYSSAKKYIASYDESNSLKGIPMVTAAN